MRHDWGQLSAYKTCFGVLSTLNPKNHYPDLSFIIFFYKKAYPDKEGYRCPFIPNVPIQQGACSKPKIFLPCPTTQPSDTISITTPILSQSSLISPPSPLQTSLNHRSVFQAPRSKFSPLFPCPPPPRKGSSPSGKNGILPRPWPCQWEMLSLLF